jgi:hypothetical protein
MMNLDFTNIPLSTRVENNQPFVFDAIRRKWVKLTPEEHVRQLLIGYMISYCNYPKGLIAVEKQIKVVKMQKRFDVVVFDTNHAPWLLVECKAPDVPITEQTLLQLLHYQETVKSLYWLLTNGHQSFCADARDIQNIMWMPSLPAF